LFLKKDAFSPLIQVKVDGSAHGDKIEFICKVTLARSFRDWSQADPAQFSDLQAKSVDADGGPMTRTQIPAIKSK